MVNQKKHFLKLLALAAFLIPAVFATAGEAEQKADVAVIEIHGEIDRAMFAFVRRAIAEAKEREPEFYIFDIDTFGGRVDYALQITTQIGDVENSIAYVTNGPDSKGVSWSAGAIIALSCSKIFMAPGTSMGAAAPVYQTSEGMEMAPEKVVSALRSKAEALAEKNGYPRGLARAMVDMDVELLEVYVNGKLRVLTAEELKDVNREAQQNGWDVREGKTISPKGKLLTLTAGEFETYGVSSGTFANLGDVYKELGLTDPKVGYYEKSATDSFVELLTSPTITSFLIIIGLITAYLEFNAPGFGIAGTASIICFAIVFIANMMLGQVGSLEIILFVLGAVLLAVELFLIPGFGIAGAGGIALITIALILALQQFVVPGNVLEWDILLKNIMLVGFSLLLSFVAMFALAAVMPQTPFYSKLALVSSQQTSEGFTVQPEESTKNLIGRRGMTSTALHPTGKAEIEGELMTVDTDGEYIEAGVPVEIAEINGNRIVVRKC